jgi:hypothetical protein
VQVGQLQQAYQTAKANLDLIRQEELAGTRSPDFLQRKAAAEVGVREALARMYDAHSSFYKKSGDAATAKGNKQTVNVKTVENQDGTQSLVSTIVVNGEPYQQVFTPPRFSDIRAATEAATKEVNKETPSAWNPFAGAAPYVGTAQEEIARRAKQYMEPKLITVNPRGQQITPEAFEALGNPAPAQAAPTAVAPTAPTAVPPPAGMPTGEREIPKGPFPMPSARRVSGSPPGYPVESQDQAVGATERSLGIIRGELRDARQKGQPTEALEREEQRAMESLKKGAPKHEKSETKPNRGAMSFERDADGKVVPRGGQQAPQVATPAAQPAPVADPTEQAGQAVELTRSNLIRARQAMMSYGAIQQRKDPTGYRNALARVMQAQAEAAEAQQVYENLAAPNVGPATFGTMPDRSGLKLR